MEWTDETIAQLRALWAEGHSTAEIGRRLGCNKNAIVGKAHRIDLPSRPSPIRRDVPRPPSPTRGSGATLPPLASLFDAAAPDRRFIPGQRQPPIRPPQTSAARPAPIKSQPVVASYGRVAPCCWPIGEPRTKSFRFCGAPSAPGRPYCAEHCAVAYVPTRYRQDQAA